MPTWRGAQRAREGGTLRAREVGTQRARRRDSNVGSRVGAKLDSQLRQVTCSDGNC